MKNRLLILLSVLILPFSSFVFADMAPEKMQMMRMMQHVNPMPNLMKVIIQQDDQLDLTEEQSNALKGWRSKNHPRMKKIAEQVVALEKKLADEALAGAPGAALQQITNQILSARENIIKGKLACRNHIHGILNQEQWDKLVELYKAGQQPAAKS